MTFISSQPPFVIKYYLNYSPIYLYFLTVSIFYDLQGIIQKFQTAS